MGYYEVDGTYIPDLGWCQECGKGIGGNSLERYPNPRSNNHIICKSCMREMFADRPNLAGKVTIRLGPTSSGRFNPISDMEDGYTNWKIEYSPDAKGQDYRDLINGVVTYCECNPVEWKKGKYLPNWSSSQQYSKVSHFNEYGFKIELYDSNWRSLFGSIPCSCNGYIDGRTEWFKQHCDRVDQGESAELIADFRNINRWSAMQRRATSRNYQVTPTGNKVNKFWSGWAV